MPFGAVFTATCVAAAIGCFLMAFLANYPIALAPGMGLNAYFAFGVVGGMGYSWQVALGCVFISGVIFFIISVLPIREWIVNAIPKSLKMAIAAGIGLFLALIALKNAGIVVAHPATLVTHGKLTSFPVVMATLGFFLIVALEYRRVMGGVIIGILVVTIIAIAAGQQKFGGIFDMPPSIAPVFLQMDLAGALQVGLVTVVFAFLFVDLFDNTGTLIALAHRGGFMRPDGTVPRLHGALIADSGAAMIGAAVGTSTTTSYIESASGINAGGRTGLTAADRRHPLPAGAVRGAARRLDPRLRHGAGAALRRLPDGAQPHRGRMGRHHRSRTRRHHRDHDALHLLDRRRHRVRIHFVRRNQSRDRTLSRCSSGSRNSRCAVRDQVCGHRMITHRARTFVCRRTICPLTIVLIGSGRSKEKVLARRWLPAK